MAVATQPRHDVAVERVEANAYEIPTDGPDGRETDGTLEWRATTIVVVEAHAGGETGLGYTYADAAAATLVESRLVDVAAGADALAVGEVWERMAAALRNAGRPGVGSMALAAVDIALWDLKARLLGLPLVDVLGRRRDAVPLYASGGFCNYPLERLREQVAGWVEQGIPRVKVKTSREPERDPERLEAVRGAAGDDVELYVDANGALTPKEALAWAERFAAGWGVSWLEEPVSSDDIAGLRLVRERAPAGLDIAAGEYVFILRDAVALLEAGAVDCLQLDVTRCGGITGLLQAAGAATAHSVEISGHCAPAISAHAFCALPGVRHVEYFHDHARVEPLLFDGTLPPDGGALAPDRSRPGHGLELRRADAERYAL